MLPQPDLQTSSRRSRSPPLALTPLRRLSGLEESRRFRPSFGRFVGLKLAETLEPLMDESLSDEEDKSSFLKREEVVGTCLRVRSSSGSDRRETIAPTNLLEVDELGLAWLYPGVRNCGEILYNHLDRLQFT
eukprot:768012-Hanusia_phi.AAC.1